MRIGLFTDTYYPEINGVATSTQQLKKGLELLGNEVFVIAPSNPVKYNEEKSVIRKKSMAFLLLRDRRLSFYVTPLALKTIEELDLDIIHSQTEFSIGHIARKAHRKFKIPLVHTYHTVYEDYTHYFKIWGKNSRFVKNIVRKLSKTFCNKADAVVVPTEKVKKLLESYGLNKKIYIQPTGIDSQKFSDPDLNKVAQLKRKYNINSKNKILVCAGRMSKEKNTVELIRFLPSIIEKQPDTIMIIIGDGPEHTHLKKEVKKLKLENNIIFTGSVPWSEIENYYALGDIFVCGSTSETQGLTYIEALAAGKPLLVRYDNCLKEVLINHKNGIGYSNEDEFVSGYFEISNNYESMADEGLKISQKYSNITFAENMLKIYKTLKKRRNS